MFKKTQVATFICSVLCSTVGMANSAQNAENKSNMLHEIVVYGDNNKSLSSVKTVTTEDMKRTPAANNNISDYLRDNPHIRYENSDQNGAQRGEIKPENISINGADVNQTAYFVDNVNINNDLGVDSSVFDGSIQTVPGISHTQAYFFDANMLSKVEVHDSNISASLGGFMGGAVVAKTKQYSGKDGVKLHYRTTRSSWAKMETTDKVKNALAKAIPSSSGVAELQPKYNKQTFGITVEKGLSDNLGMVAGFSRRTSHIAQNRLIGYDSEAHLDKQDHKRISDTALLNFNWQAREQDRFELGFRYSNYKEEKYYQNSIGNNVADYHQAFGSTLAWVHAFDSGVWTNTLAYDHFKDKRKSTSANVKTIAVYDNNFDVIYNYELGGYGNSSLTQDNFHFSTEYAINPFDLGETNHSISIGGIYQATKYKYHRPQDVHSEILDKYPNMPLSLLFEDSMLKGNINTSYQNVVFYGENLIKWRNFEFRPGIRMERDDYLRNNNIAPRFVTRYKPWEDTGFTFGWNRYYGRSFASLKLAHEILKLNKDNSRKDQKFDLKTPHADELSIGLEQNLGNLAFKLNYVNRKNKDRIILQKEGSKSFYVNGNNFNVNVYTFQMNNVEPWKLGNTYWSTSLGFDWLDTKRADLGLDYDPNSLVYLDGKLMTQRQMTQKVNSNNEDWIARLGISMDIPEYNFTWSNKIYVKAPVRYTEDLDSDLNGIPRYRSYDYGRHTQWDTTIRWQPTITGNHSVYVQLDVLNVLNKTRKNKNTTISTNDEYGVYTPGREFWLEVGYQF